MGIVVPKETHPKILPSTLVVGEVCAYEQTFESNFTIHLRFTSSRFDARFDLVPINSQALDSILIQLSISVYSVNAHFGYL